MLFRTANISDVKAYVQNQLKKVLDDKVGFQDFIFAKEYRGMSGYKPGACVPALEIARYLASKIFNQLTVFICYAVFAMIT